MPRSRFVFIHCSMAERSDVSESAWCEAAVPAFTPRQKRPRRTTRISSDESGRCGAVDCCEDGRAAAAAGAADEADAAAGAADEAEDARGGLLTGSSRPTPPRAAVLAPGI